jgi:hypothetical protein
MSPIGHPTLDTFLLGFITACSLLAALYFLRFWKSTRDFLFLAFALFFALQGLSVAMTAALPQPNMSSPWIFVARLAAIVVVLAAIVKNHFAKD